MKTAEEILIETADLTRGVKIAGHCPVSFTHAIKAMKDYHAQFSQQPTEKTREGAIELVSKYFVDENRIVGNNLAEILIDALGREGYIQSDSVDISQYSEEPECPQCAELLDHDFHYCSGCGRKINWI